MTLFTTDCPRCRVLTSKLDAKHVPYEKEHDITEVIEKGFTSAPILKLDDGRYLGFTEANSYVNSL